MMLIEILGIVFNPKVVLRAQYFYNNFLTKLKSQKAIIT